MFVVVKGHKIRICLDPKDLDKALKRQQYLLPTIKEISTNLGAKFFSAGCNKGILVAESRQVSSN